MPLRKDDALLGTITAYRQEVRPFTDKQIALLQNFAAQAVIAMENARLITETREALEQQTATAEVLQVINASPGDLAPVFDAMLEKAMRLCEAAFGHLHTYDGERFQPVARARRAAALPSAGCTARPVQPRPARRWARSCAGEPFVHIADAREDRQLTATPEFASDGRPQRASARRLTVALRKDDVLLGAITVYRQEVRPFSDKQIALLQNFAAQAVIAMENARLITETREALEQQTATAEVLQVINSSPGDLAPVFDAMLEKAMRLCEAAFGSLWTYDGEQLPRCRAAAACPRPMPNVLARAVPPPGSEIRPGCMRRRSRFVTSPTCADDALPARRSLTPRAWSISAVRAPSLIVPLRKDDALLGAITRLPPGGAAVHRQADRAVAELRGAGGHRDGERAADHRDARGAGAADRDRRGVAGHQLLARRPRAGVRRDAGEGAYVCARRRSASC